MKRKLLIVTVIVVVGMYILLEYSPVAQFIAAVQRHPADGDAAAWMRGGEPKERLDREEDQREEALLARIRDEAERLREAPIDAKVDRVWHAIPGYNGIEVDLEATLAVNRGKGAAEDLIFVYREVEPKIQLEDLGAHPIYKGNPKKKMVGFMINVAWGDEHLPGMLATLEKEGIQATFFFDGSWLAKNIEQAKEICEAGHECSNHAYSHPNMSRLSRAKQEEEILKTEALLKDELGVENRWFAPPSGDYNQLTVEIAYQHGLRTVLWTIDTVDWKNPEPDWIVRRIAARLEPGSLILMHPTSSAAQALPGMIETIRAEGYAFGTVSEVLSSKRMLDIEGAFDF